MSITIKGISTGKGFHNKEKLNEMSQRKREIVYSTPATVTSGASISLSDVLAADEKTFDDIIGIAASLYIYGEESTTIPDFFEASGLVDFRGTATDGRKFTRVKVIDFMAGAFAKVWFSVYDDNTLSVSVDYVDIDNLATSKTPYKVELTQLNIYYQ